LVIPENTYNRRYKNTCGKEQKCIVIEVHYLRGGQPDEQARHWKGRINDQN